MLFIENFEINSSYIACEPLHDNHTEEYLSEIINKICEDWCFSHKKIVSVTTDIGSNIVKAIKITFDRAKHMLSTYTELGVSVNTTYLKLFLLKY